MFKQFFCVSPMTLSNCMREELEVLGRAVFQPGSEVRHMMLNLRLPDAEEHRVYVFANEHEKLSDVM